MEPTRNTTDIKYREYRDGDEKTIIELFNFVFKRNFSVDDWHWTYRENPVDRRDIILAFSGTQLVGQAASTPLTYNHNGNLMKTTRTQNVMVHPEFQGRGIFTTALKKLTEHCYREKLDLVVTFPNNNSLPTFIRKLDYCHADDIHTYQAVAGAMQKPVSPSLTMTIDETVSFSQADHDFMQNCLKSYAYFNERSLPYLAWRFGPRSKKPYRLLRAYENGRLSALVLFKYYTDAAGVDLVEFFHDSDASLIPSILQRICLYYAEKGTPACSFSIWLMPHYRTFGLFTSAGFAKTSFVTHMVTKSFSQRTADGSDLSTSYYLAMGDSDVY